VNSLGIEANRATSAMIQGTALAEALRDEK